LEIREFFRIDLNPTLPSPNPTKPRSPFLHRNQLGAGVVGMESLEMFRINRDIVEELLKETLKDAEL
jgi:hypothetical protein